MEPELGQLRKQRMAELSAILEELSLRGELAPSKLVRSQNLEAL